jgi:hypothetical protein
MVEDYKGKHHKQKRELQRKGRTTKYFPDDYFKWMFQSGGIPEQLKEEANKWYCDYIELMEYRKNPRYERTKCFRCLLSPSREEAAIFLGINKVIARAIEQENNNISSTIYPCPN